ncbi:retrovirus-related Pol polyprotein from transposon 412 [Trichonephila clavipes]|nr:retrovirus-related Pol polyprotein from transposon 412 [Trichonephila clavipes]
MIADQMKKRCSPECKGHYLDIWEELISPEMLADKLEAFDNIRAVFPTQWTKETCEGNLGALPAHNPNSSQRTDVATNHTNAYTAQTRNPRLTLIDITFCGIKGRVCADTGSTHSIPGERMYPVFKDKGLLFQETTLAMSLADGQQTTGEALTTQVMVEIEGRSVLTKFIILPKAKGNRTLLGTDFLSSTGLVLDVKNACWYLWDNPTHKYPFCEELDTASIDEKMSSNICQLREGEGESLTSVQKEKLNLLLKSFQNVFNQGEKQQLSWSTALAREIKWSEEEEKAFQTLKQCLVSPLILKQADFSKPFLIRTDASNYALGVVLLQGKNKEEHPGEFARRLLNPAERNYSITEREALAMTSPLGSAITVFQSQHGEENIPGKSNVVADMLSRTACHEKNEQCEVCTVAIDVPSRSPKEIPDEQLKDEELVKIISCLEDPDKNVNYVNWVERSYLMNQGVLYRYAPDSESEEAQLVAAPSHERILIPKNHHDAPMNCPDCLKYKASNQKSSGLLQTPVPAQHFEILAIDLFGPLPESKDVKRWILIIEDCTTKWVEMLALPNATAKECATTLIEEVLLRELHTPSEVVNDIWVIIQDDNFVPEITPYLKKFAKFSTQIREVVEEQQDSRKFYTDKKRKVAPTYQPGEHVLVASHPLSNLAQGKSAKLMPHRDGLNMILTQRSPSSYEIIASLDNPGEPLGVYPTSALTPFNSDRVKPLFPLHKRGCPPKVQQTPGSSSGRHRNQRGRM